MGFHAKEKAIDDGCRGDDEMVCLSKGIETFMNKQEVEESKDHLGTCALQKPGDAQLQTDKPQVGSNTSSVLQERGDGLVGRSTVVGKTLSPGDVEAKNSCRQA
ncbi:hypothetical protein Ancab_011071 [Ancistrocladus abbreviatus]